ncbi:MAG: carotenoid biosynthesis protein [Rhodobacteraceae bacterium]|nr:carotenoid biosynthesis protein [Paracoccaceae bacterium]
MRDPNENKMQLTLLALAAMAWVGNAIYGASALGGMAKELAPGIVAFSMIAFLILHSRRHYSPGWVVTFFAITGLVAWMAESVGISTGLPFGRYQYSTVMAPFLGQVPITVLFAYAVMGYLSWSLARIYISVLIPDNRTARRWLTPLFGAAFMVIWDLSMDPLRATFEGRWIWLEGGVYFGIPLLNFLGWFLVTWVIFQIFALLSEGKARAGKLQQDWAVPLMYAAFAGEYLLNPIFGAGSERLIAVNGQMVAAGDFYTSVASICLTSMIPAALGGLVLLRFGAGKPLAKRMAASKTPNFPGNRPGNRSGKDAE